jgi:prepilin-type N-terminal cleavage/methylation domain-containing protein
MQHTQSVRGFSLVELAIVLVIIGLLTSGVLVGQNMIRSSEVRSIMGDANRYIEAVYTFRDTYSALPGDMPDATDTWGAAAPLLADCIETPTRSTATCDGDGDGAIGDDAGSLYERHSAWKQLANAGLVEGGLTGAVIDSDTPGLSRVDVNAPASQIKGVGFSWAYVVGVTAGDDDFFPFPGGHLLYVGRQSTDAGLFNFAFSAEEAESIDEKMDDGAPGTGKVRGWKSTSDTNPGCTSSDDPATAIYDMTAEGLRCSIFFVTGF